ncbi:hypothetical protein VKT23_012833 [Stygiomarasmius scandens]|uniref:BTB domain-containing protein n=1 Tax=Marasmiellus scandens TaxID=2682957 RepID=A0ABR1J775_9AGAR
MVADDGVIPLSETAAVLEILFQYIYPETAPALNDLPFETLLEVAKAAEKYDIYLARSACVLEMVGWVNDQPREVFRFAAMHGYTSLMNAAERRDRSVVYEALNG